MYYAYSEDDVLWIYSSWCRSWSPYQSYEPAKSYSLMPIRSLCCLWHHWSFYSPASSLTMVRPQWQGSLMALVILGISKFCCEYQLSVSDQFPLHQKVPQGSVLGPFLFILYITPSALISLTHHRHADDTQLFIFFAASDSSANILRLQATIDLV